MNKNITLREAMKLGVLGVAGLAASFYGPGRAYGRASDPKLNVPNIMDASKRKAKSVIQIFLWGGMSHNDTWDPKPDSGYDYMGAFAKAIPTNVDGIQIGEMFPKLAQQADKYSLIRSMTHGNNGHETAAYLMQTGHTPGERLAYPSIGSVFAFGNIQQKYKGLIPPQVVLTKAQGRFSEEGFLGPTVKPFATGGDPNAERFEVEGVVARGITEQRQKDRRGLLNRMNTMKKAMGESPQLVAADEAENDAYKLILGEGKDVFDLALDEKKNPGIREKYGRNTFGQSCLAARRLVEAGVPYIVINYPGGWDTHSNHFQTMRRQVPELDNGLAFLLQDLKDRGLLETTLVWCSGEFGRTPKIDWQPPWNGGRGHYGDVFTVLVAGGGFKGGVVVGESDAKGEKVKKRPVYPVDLLGSIYQLGGVNTSARLPHPEGKDAFVLPSTAEGVNSGGLLTEIM